ncbi:MAG: hypothetical protein AAGF97_07570 [Planctomycetota bacterium]
MISRRWQRRLLVLICLLFATSFAEAAGPTRDAQLPGAAPGAPRNPFLADSTWPMTHAGPYNQASTDAPGPLRPNDAQPSFLEGEAVPITLAVSSAYPDGSRVIWGKTLKYVSKVDVTSGKMSYYARVPRENAIQEAISGAYSLVDCDGVFFAPQGDVIEGFADAVKDDPESAIEVRFQYQIPPRLTQGTPTRIVGMNMTYDGRIVFVTESGLLGSLSRQLDDGKYLQLPMAPRETISNTIAIDETNGIFVLTSRQLHRIDWRSEKPAPLEVAWSTPYATDEMRAKGRLGTGSGTTPSLVGTGEQEDQFVVICDGQRLMHMVLFWRGNIPADWEGLPGKDRRIAAEVPVNFGDPKAEMSTTEQSITVRGYEMVTVSNKYGDIGPLVKRLFKTRGIGVHNATIHQSYRASIAPYGAEKFTWDPKSRQLVSTWANPKLSCPNGVPTMSAQTGLLYCMGQRNSEWTLEAVDWETGESKFYQVLSRDPANNSFYAATEIGPDGMIITGTYGGILRFHRPGPTFAATQGN